METAVNISKLFIPIIAIIGIYIAWHQYHTNREKIRFDLYEKRFKIYDSIVQYINDLLWAMDADSLSDQRSSFETACNEADFLLPDSVCNVIKDIREDIRRLHNVNTKLEYISRRGEGAQNAEAARNEIIELEKKLENIPLTLKESFKVVLKFERF